MQAGLTKGGKGKEGQRGRVPEYNQCADAVRGSSAPGRGASVGVALPRLWATSGNPSGVVGLTWSFSKQTWRKQMPIIAWLLGVPVTVIILLMLFGVF
jgi:hypothetical protein